MEIKILGVGCQRCEKVYEMVERAVNEMGIDAKIVRIKDINDIIDHGVFTVPALVVDGEVVLAGKLPSYEEVKRILEGEKNKK
jgi:small redox-active disulfide protein 2